MKKLKLAFVTLFIFLPLLGFMQVMPISFFQKKAAANVSYAAGNALNFDGVDDYTIANLSAATAITSTFTIEMYIKPSVSQTTKGLFQWANGLNAGNPMVLFQQNGTTLNAYVNYGYNLQATIPIDSWTHVALAYNGTVYTLYINGAAVTTYTGAIAGQADATKLFFGNGYNGYWNGSIDDVKIWNTARTQSQIQANLDTELNGNETGLLA